MGSSPRLQGMEGMDGAVQSERKPNRFIQCLRVLRQCDHARGAQALWRRTDARELVKQAASLNDLEIPMLLPGIKINTSATDFYPIQSVRLQRFKGETWELFGDVISNESH